MNVFLKWWESVADFSRSTCWFHFLFMATPVACGSSLARVWIGAPAASLCHSHSHSHSNTGSELHPQPLQPMLHLQQHQVLNPLSKARDQICILTDTMPGSQHMGPQRELPMIWFYFRKTSLNDMYRIDYRERLAKTPKCFEERKCYYLMTGLLDCMEKTGGRNQCEKKNVCMCMTGSLCCTTEIDRIL